MISFLLLKKGRGLGNMILLPTLSEERQIHWHNNGTKGGILQVEIEKTVDISGAPAATRTQS